MSYSATVPFVSFRKRLTVETYQGITTTRRQAEELTMASGENWEHVPPADR